MLVNFELQPIYQIFYSTLYLLPLAISKSARLIWDDKKPHVEQARAGLLFSLVLNFGNHGFFCRIFRQNFLSFLYLFFCFFECSNNKQLAEKQISEDSCKTWGPFFQLKTLSFDIHIPASQKNQLYGLQLVLFYIWTRNSVTNLLIALLPFFSGICPSTSYSHYQTEHFLPAIT